MARRGRRGKAAADRLVYLARYLDDTHSVVHSTMPMARAVAFLRAEGNADLAEALEATPADKVPAIVETAHHEIAIQSVDRTFVVPRRPVWMSPGGSA